MTSDPYSAATDNDPPRRRNRPQALHRLAVFADLGSDVIERLAPACSFVSYLASDTIVQSGHFDGQQLIGLTQGTARLVKPAARAGDFDVTELSEGTLVGLAEFLAYPDPVKSALSITAVTDADVAIIDATEIRLLMKAEPGLKDAFLRFTAQQWLASSSARFTEAGPDRRIYQHLLSLVQRDGPRYIIGEMPRHAALAELCGTTDRDAAAAVAVLIDSEIARREYPGLVIEDISAFRAVCF